MAAQTSLLISYEYADGASAAAQLRVALPLAGFNVWPDVGELHKSSDWKSQLRKVIAAVDAVVVVLTPEAVASRQVMWVCDTAQTLGRTIIGVLAISVELPPELADLPCHDVTSAERFVEGYSTLIRALHELVLPATREVQMYDVVGTRNDSPVEQVEIDSGSIVIKILLKKSYFVSDSTLLGAPRQSAPEVSVRLDSNVITSEAISSTPASFNEAAQPHLLSDITLEGIQHEMKEKSVFLVYGHAEAANECVKDVLRAMSLEPIEFNRMSTMTRKTSPSIMEVLQTGFANAQAIVVVLTPDEVVKRRDELGGDQQGYQPRPNVLIEAGMAFGIQPDRTILLKFGEIRPASDLSGLHLIEVRNSPSWRQVLRDRLSLAGCAIPEGITDYLTKGDCSKLY